MNEQRNTTLIQEVYAAFGRGDIQTIMKTLTEDTVWTMEGPELIPYCGKRNGLSEVLGFFAALSDTQSDMKLTITEYVAQGDRVATLGRYAATVKATGKKFDCPVAHLFTIREGKISGFVAVGDTAAMAGAYQASAAAAH